MPPVLSKPLEAFAVASSAGLGGCLSTLLLYPLDTIKTRMQSSSSVSGSWYRGVQYKIVQSCSAKFLYFYYYSMLCSLMKRHKCLNTFTQLIAGYLAEAMHLPITIPIEMVATRIQTAKDSKGVFDTIRDIVQSGNGSFTSFYKGWESYVVLCLQPAIQFTIFEQAKQWYLKRSKSLTLIEAFILGAVSRAIATCMVYPYIRVKVLLQTKSNTANHSVWKLLQEEGPFALYRGLLPEVTRGALSSALMLALKEKIHVYNRLGLILLLTRLKK